MKMANSKTKKIMMLILCLGIFLSVFISLTNKTVAFNPAKWLMCKTDKGKDVLTWAYTDALPHKLNSIPTIGKADDGVNTFPNRILRLTGYKIGEDSASDFFGKFGLSGLVYSVYRGEWKYYTVDVCRDDDRQTAEGQDYGVYYIKRKEPLDTYNRIGNSKDVRTNAFKPYLDTSRAFLTNKISNTLLTISKYIMAITLAFISLAFSDLRLVLGLDDSVFNRSIVNYGYNLFLPLSVIVFVIVGAVLFYEGFIKRQLRATMSKVGYALLAFVIGVCYYMNPNLALVPIHAANLVSNAVTSVFVDTKGNENIAYNDEICKQIQTDTNKKDGLTLEDIGDKAKSQIGCSIYRDFLFKPFIKAQFGSDYEDMTHLANTNSEWVGSPRAFNVTNWGAFYVSVMSGLHEPLDGERGVYINGVPRDYFRIVDALSNYDEKLSYEADGTAIPEVLDNKPLKEFTNLMGGDESNKLVHSFIILLTNIVALFPLISIAVFITVESFVLIVLTFLFPVIALLMCLQVGSFGILVKRHFIAMYMSAIVTKAVSGVVLIISARLLSYVFTIFETVGFIQAVILLYLLSYVVHKNYRRIIVFIERMFIETRIHLMENNPFKATKKVKNTVRKLSKGGNTTIKSLTTLGRIRSSSGK